jgi:hypothetical protein
LAEMVKLDNKVIIVALVLDIQGTYEETEWMYWQTLKKALCEKHPNTLSSMNSPALMQRSQGKYAKRRKCTD